MKRSTRVWQAFDAGSWFGFAAAPTFALMAWISAADAPHMAMDASASGVPPIDGMAFMYLLMTVFHASPWLKLASDRLRHPIQPTSQSEGD